MFLNQYVSPFVKFDFASLYNANDWSGVRELAKQECEFYKDMTLKLSSKEVKYSWDLHYAIRTNDIDFVKNNIPHDTPDRIRVERFHAFIAAELPDQTILQLIMDNDNKYNTRKNHIMLNAVETDNPSLLKFALENGANPNEWAGKVYKDYVNKINASIMSLLLTHGFNPTRLGPYQRSLWVQKLSALFDNDLNLLPVGDYLNDEFLISLIIKQFVKYAENDLMAFMKNSPEKFQPNILNEITI